MTYTVEPITDRGETKYIVRDANGNPVNGIHHKTEAEAQRQKDNVEAVMRGMEKQRRAA